MHSFGVLVLDGDFDQNMFQGKLYISLLMQGHKLLRIPGD